MASPTTRRFVSALSTNVVAALICTTFLGCTQETIDDSQGFGKFDGDVVAVWSQDGRDMILREPFSYIDGSNRVWTAPAGATVNGASIPYAFWSFIGGPFEGRYRNASVVHDVGCEQMTESWQDVHRMFYDACRCGGVDETQAKMLYYAVYHFGPRWESASDGTGNTQLIRRDPVPPTPEEISELETYVSQENPSAETIRSHDRRQLHSHPSRPSGESRRSVSGDFADRWQNQQRNERRGRRSGPRELSVETEEQVIAIVQSHVTSQTGEERPATYAVTPQRGGFRVDVQFVHETAEGQAAPDTGGKSVAFVSVNGQLIEFVSQ
ncbi:DUF1353 domain-containing protein [Planctomycetes bacterium K23_9]|uniref:DUF1353 domain-containing protein n=1 Tax=Stieleria marina TaxID=1930275 RepID=A0A517NXQ5_9BACT|nr:hypothetical protein K239x_39130 [Planctomycetes bacterium K23_9]